MTATPDAADALNEVLGREYRSLPRYLARAEVWAPPSGRPALDLLKRIDAAQEAVCRRLAEAVLLRRGVPDMGEYPSEYARYHFLKLSFLRPTILAAQDQLVADLARAAAALDFDPEAQALVADALGMEKAHREQLVETLPK